MGGILAGVNDHLNCSNCDAKVPEGAIACPKCKASIGTVMFGRKRGLTRTMIGKAVELRESIPWASASAVILVDDGAGRKKLRVGRTIALSVVLIAVVGGSYLWLTGSLATAMTRAPEISAEVTRPAGGLHRGILDVQAFHEGHPVAAKVLVNGENKGLTPVSTALPPGKYTLKLVKAGYRTEKRINVEVVANKSAVLKVDLEPR